jgi:amidase
VGRASGRRQVMLTDLYEEMLPVTAAEIDKVNELNKIIPMET